MTPENKDITFSKEPNKFEKQDFVGQWEGTGLKETAMRTSFFRMHIVERQPVEGSSIGAVYIKGIMHDSFGPANFSGIINDGSICFTKTHIDVSVRKGAITENVFYEGKFDEESKEYAGTFGFISREEAGTFTMKPKEKTK
jgi:hypothetical protein